MNRSHVKDSVIAIKNAIDKNPLSREALKTLAPKFMLKKSILPAFKQITEVQ